MTTPAAAELTRLLTRTTCLLLDFDGPICAVFAGRPSHTIVLELIRILSTENIPVPANIANTRDPFEVLRYAATITPQLTQRIECHLQAAEVTATRTATPTPHAREAIAAWRRGKRLAAIVSNNSAAAVTTYLAAHSIDVDLVVARTSPDPTLLKPSPHLVISTLRALNRVSDACVFLGDSVSDIIAAQRAGVRSIGYANAHRKRQALSDAGAHVIIDDMATLSRAAGACA